MTDPPGDPSASFAAARSIPRGTPGRFMPFLEATERLRAAIAGDGPVPSPSDVCQWQVGLLRYLDERRDVLLDSGTATSPNTAEVLARMARAAESVEELRVSDDPLVAGPAPRDPRLRDAWRKLRTTRIDPVEAELDRILSMVRGDFAPELAQQIWPARYVSCLTACERYFEQRTRVGEERAHNRELALAQWPTILAATDALAALAELTAATARDTRAGR